MTQFSNSNHTTSFYLSRAIRRRVSLPNLTTSSTYRVHDDRWAWLDLSDTVSCQTSHTSHSDQSTDYSNSDGGTHQDRPSLLSTAPTTVFNESVKTTDDPTQILHSSRMSHYHVQLDKFPRPHEIFQRGYFSRTLPSANVYIRPLPPSFNDLELEALCTSVTSNLKFSNMHKILSVKVMIEEDDGAKLGSCKGYGFCLWNSIDAASICIDGLRAEGYQASFAVRFRPFDSSSYLQSLGSTLQINLILTSVEFYKRETSRGMLSSLADPASANIYLSNLPHTWGESNLIALFGGTQISSIRLLRDRDEEAVGSGESRGVGFVRLVNRKEALRFVQKLHGLAVDGTDHQIHCRMADSKAQKEWKRAARSRHDQSFSPNRDQSGPRNLHTQAKPSLADRWVPGRPNYLKQQCGPRDILNSDRVTSHEMRSNVHSFNGAFFGPRGQNLPPTSLAPTASPFAMPNLSPPPFGSPLSIQFSSPSPVLNASVPRTPPSSLSNDPNHIFLNSSGPSFLTGCYPGIAGGLRKNSMAYSHTSNTAVNFIYSSSDPHQSTNPNYATDHNTWPETEINPFYGATAASCTTNFCPSPMSYCNGPSSPDPSSDQCRFQVQADLGPKAWNHSEANTSISQPTSPIATN
ncbi:hypothetical protein CROQUDRAFT_111355 [Cronartium quercuum f. sp. fusiforme G11]|uniref:RRM domain-containing protein n=1 Tax=Cronartium quercuum f. sp. fusiforme G11 TaxID=708437 RepID=A0A9P6NA30_9BASI|nr:hypothetical protein CROQUDRAFT_111355 [Cronartium quercuum f. sp. fusiforme G11]